MSYNPGPTGGKPPKTKIPGYSQYQIDKFTPEMKQLYDSMVGSVGPGAVSGTDWLSKIAGGDESAFEEMEKPAYNAFEKQLGSIGNRYSHLGALDSNYFENATAGAGRELQENLQSKRTKLRQEATNSLLDQSNRLMDKEPYEHFMKKKKSNWDWIKEFIELYQNSDDSGDWDKFMKMFAASQGAPGG